MSEGNPGPASPLSHRIPTAIPTVCPVLRVLSVDEIAGVRGWVAANPTVPGDVFDVLADDPDVTVRGVVASALSWPG